MFVNKNSSALSVDVVTLEIISDQNIVMIEVICAPVKDNINEPVTINSLFG